jgi:hypothetical protein
MKRLQIAALAGGMFFVTSAMGSTEDKEVVVTFDSVKALTAKNGTKLDGSVKFVFAKEAGNVTTGELDTGSGTTSGFNKNKEDACRWALLDALLKFQNKATLNHFTSVTDMSTSGTTDVWSGDREKLTCLAGSMIVRTRVRGRYNK